MMQAGVALQTSYSSMHTYRQIGEYKYRDNEIPGTPTYPRSQEVSGLDMGVQYHLQLVVQTLHVMMLSTTQLTCILLPVVHTTSQCMSSIERLEYTYLQHSCKQVPAQRMDLQYQLGYTRTPWSGHVVTHSATEQYTVLVSLRHVALSRCISEYIMVCRYSVLCVSVIEQHTQHTYICNMQSVQYMYHTCVYCIPYHTVYALVHTVLQHVRVLHVM